MEGEQLFESWAPSGGAWSAWAKPVLFATLRGAAGPYIDDGTIRAPEVRWAPPADQEWAIVVDLPGLDSVTVGVALTERGYRPVPLYNCCAGHREVVTTGPLIEGLIYGGTVLQLTHNLRHDAPPAFLLDSRRMQASRVQPGDFDNRWMVLPQDFPSANVLLSRNIHTVLLAHDHGSVVREDLAHVLKRWQDAGVAMYVYNVGQADAGNMRPLTVSRPSRFRWALHSFLVTLGLRPNAAGGFGAKVPVPSEGGYG